VKTEEQASSCSSPKGPPTVPLQSPRLKVGADLVPSWPNDRPEGAQAAEGKAFFLTLKLLQSNTVRQFLGLIC
jgi:hypothetical protein